MTTPVQPVSSTPTTSSAAGRFGTFAGVFTPNVLTILGIILFLRVGWVVGQAGLSGALLIISIACLISFLTGLSLSAVSTSMDVKVGGIYYLISRSLGLEIGGAIGIPLYLSQAISVAFYVIGFTEALFSLEFFQPFDPRLIATIVTLIFIVIAYIGADFALKIQFFILAILVAALLSFFGSGWDSFITPVTSPNYSDGVNFWLVFAVFFPAVTGITVGVSLSGDLKEPAKSIPLGTLSSIIVTTVIYLVVAVWFALHITPEDLISNNLAMQQMARWPILILMGVWSATLSSALGSVLAAPRTLQAIAYDSVVPTWVAKQLGSPTEPRMAVLITGVIAVSVIWLGDLDLVAPIISMFFLNTYGMINLVAAIEKIVGNPSYRPNFNIPWVASLLGAVGCYGTMFLINALATVIAIIVSYGIFFLLQRRQLKRTWGDVQSGFLFAMARQVLLRLEQQRWHVKNWRPNIIVFTGQPHNRQQLVEVAEWLSLGRGIVTFFQLIVGDFSLFAKANLRNTARQHIRDYIQDRGMTAFAEAEIVADFKQGALTIAQAHGIGALEPNGALLGWSGTEEGRSMQLDLMRHLVALGKSVLFLNYDAQRGFGQQKIINIWWRGRGGNADLMLLLAHLIKEHRSWEGAKIRLLQVIMSEKEQKPTEKHLEELLSEVRVKAKPIVIVRLTPEQPLTEVIAEWSRDADLTLLGILLPEAEQADAYSHNLNELVQAVGTVLMVRNAQLDEDLLSTG
jgi:amino acid transporter